MCSAFPVNFIYDEWISLRNHDSRGYYGQPGSPYMIPIIHTYKIVPQTSGVNNLHRTQTSSYNIYLSCNYHHLGGIMATIRCEHAPLESVVDPIMVGTAVPLSIQARQLL